jgi:UDP-glucose 4-epimerase
MRVFLTGASGFIGARLLELLRCHDVLALTREPERLLPWPFVKTLKGDLQRQELWHSALEAFRPQCCIHLAWEGLPDYSSERCSSNLDAGLHLFDTLTAVKIEKIVVAGTCWEYGSALGPACESQAPVNCNVFAATKTAMRTALEGLAIKKGFDYCWARIFFAYGSGQRPASLIPQCYAAFTAGKAPDIRNPQIVNDFIHVDDVAGGLLALAQSKTQSGIYNLGTGQPAAVGHVVDMIAAHFGAGPLFTATHHGGGFWSDPEKILAATGWRAQTPLADGIAMTLRALDGKRS